MEKQYLTDIFDNAEDLDYKLKHKRQWIFLVRFAIIELLVVLLMAAYIEIGHDKGWKRADVWYTCLHTHKHFPWQ